MDKLLHLYRIAEQESVPVLNFSLPENDSISMQDCTGKCYIGLNKNSHMTAANENVQLAHELGHCIRGAFYNRYTDFDIRKKHEIRADKWAIEQLVPEEALDHAVASGYTEIWSLAEYFDVTETFMRKAVCWYTYRNLNVEGYMNFA